MATINIDSVSDAAAALLAEIEKDKGVAKQTREANRQRVEQARPLLRQVWDELEANRSVKGCTTKARWCEKFSPTSQRNVEYILAGGNKNRPRRNVSRVIDLKNGIIVRFRGDVYKVTSLGVGKDTKKRNRVELFVEPYEQQLPEKKKTPAKLESKPEALSLNKEPQLNVRGLGGKRGDLIVGQTYTVRGLGGAPTAENNIYIGWAPCTCWECNGRVETHGEAAREKIYHFKRPGSDAVFYVTSRGRFGSPRLSFGAKPAPAKGESCGEPNRDTEDHQKCLTCGEYPHQCAGCLSVYCDCTEKDWAFGNDGITYCSAECVERANREADGERAAQKAKLAKKVHLDNDGTLTCIPSRDSAKSLTTTDKAAVTCSLCLSIIRYEEHNERYGINEKLEEYSNAIRGLKRPPSFKIWVKSRESKPAFEFPG